MAALAQQQKSNIIKKPGVVCILAVLCCALWGSAFPVIKIGYSLWQIEASDYATQILFAGVRFTLAGLLTILIGSIISKKILVPKKESLGNIVLLSLFQTVLQYVFFYIGLAKTSGAKSSILDSVSVFFSVLLAVAFMKSERLTFQKALGCALGFAGVVLINLTGSSLGTGFSVLGEGFIILSAFSYAVSSVLIKRFSQSESPVTLSGFQFALGGIVMSMAGIALGGKLICVTLKGVLIIIYLSFLSAAAYTLWSVLLKYNDVSAVTVYSFMIPVFGCLLSALMLKESLKGSFALTAAALVLVSAGIFLVNKKKNIHIGENYES